MGPDHLKALAERQARREACCNRREPALRLGARAIGAMRAGSDEMLTVGGVLSFGFAMGLLVGGANRLLVAGALIPAAAMIITLLDRSTGDRASHMARPLQGR